MEGSNSVGPGGSLAMTFVVRLSRDEAGRLTGVVERVRTGEKSRVDGLEAISGVIGRMVMADASDDARPDAGVDGA